MITNLQYLSGKVRRWHTHHSLDQTTGDHSWGVAFIIAMLHPNPSAALLKAALFHDCGEKLTGDMPSTMKAQDPDIKDLMDTLEKAARHRMGIPDVPLTDEDKAWLSFADAYEALLFLSTRNMTASPTLDIPGIQSKMMKNAQFLGLTQFTDPLKFAAEQAAAQSRRTQ